MERILTEKTALVTGGSRGIGRAIALALAERGADVAITYFQNPKAAEETAERIRGHGVASSIHRVNIAELDQITALFEEVGERYGHLDVYVNNAVSSNMKPLADLTARHWDRVISANLSSFFHAGKLAMSLMEGRSGRIVAISSLGSRFYLPGYGALAVAKAGTETLVRYMAVEWAGRGVNVNAICGGVVDTQALGALSGAGVEMDRFKEEMARRTPEGRLGTPEDFAKVVVFLCSSGAAWIRGQTLVVDGALSDVLWNDEGSA